MYGLYTCDNVDNYGRPLTEVYPVTFPTRNYLYIVSGSLTVNGSYFRKFGISNLVNLPTRNKSINYCFNWGQLPEQSRTLVAQIVHSLLVNLLWWSYQGLEKWFAERSLNIRIKPSPMTPYTSISKMSLRPFIGK